MLNSVVSVSSNQMAMTVRVTQPDIISFKVKTGCVRHLLLSASAAVYGLSFV